MNEITFLAGRDSAVALLREGRRIGAQAPDAAAIEIEFREGQPQNNWVLPIIRQIVERPELAPGFCAVLSDYLTSSGGADPECFEDLSIADIVGAGNGAESEASHA